MIGNPEVVELLEAALAAAKAEKWGHAVVVMTGHPDVGVIEYAGEIGLEPLAREAVSIAARRLDDSIKGWSFPPQNPKLDASYVRYNLGTAPLGFDFLLWLVDAEMTRRREGAPGPLKVALWGGRDSARDVNREARQAWSENVFRPAIDMIGAVVDGRAIEGRCKEFYLPGDICSAARAGEAVPKFASPYPSGKCGIVTITLREASHNQHRNSNIEAWLKFAANLVRGGERVIVVRDTAKADEPFYGIETCPEASRDLYARAALYQQAKCNLFVSNGPNILALFGTSPFLIFCGAEAGSDARLQNNVPGWRERNGIAEGEQYPWCGPNQRLVWKVDSYDHLMESWEQMAPTLARAA